MKRINRTELEVVEFFDKIDWCIDEEYRKLIKSSDYIEKYRGVYSYNKEYRETAEKVINFFWEVPMPFGVFWDDDVSLIEFGFMQINDEYPDDSKFKYTRYVSGQDRESWKNFKELKNWDKLQEYNK